MSDKNEEVEITLKANIKQLQQSLKQIPGMTKEEASKMVRALSAEMKRATNASKKAAAESKKAAASQKRAYQQAAAEAKKSIQSSSVAYQRSVNNSKKATQQFGRETRKQSREMGAAFGSLEDVVGALDPELAGLASTVGVLGQGLRSLSRTLATGNPYVLALVGLVAAASVAYALFNLKQREAERKQKVLTAAIKKTNERLAEQANIIRGLNKTEAASQRELMVLTGEMTQLEADKAALRDQSSEALERDIIQQNKFIKEEEKILEISKKAAKSKHSLSESEREILEAALMRSKDAKIRNALDENNIVLGNLMLQFAREQNERIKEQKILLAGIQTRHDENLKRQESILEYKAEEAAADEYLEQKEKAKADALAKRAELEEDARKKQAEADAERLRLLKLSEQLEDKLSKQREQNFQADINVARQQAQFISDEEQRKQMLLNLDKQVLENKISQIEQEKAANLALAETEEQKTLAKQLNLELEEKIDLLKEEFHIKEVKRGEERVKQLEKEKKKREDLAFAIGGTFSEAAKATSELIKQVSKEDQQAALVAFRIAQAAAIADIAMTTAKKVMEVAPNPLAMGAVGAIGALQAATVIAQSPPEKHMGGFISKGEDTRNVTVLTGEAVLDRRTVERLGGEAGINQLQRTGSTQKPEIILMNPFKHFDRYARSSFKRGGFLSKMNTTKASGAY